MHTSSLPLFRGPPSDLTLIIAGKCRKHQDYSITPHLELWITLIKVEEELSYVTSAGRRDKGLIAKKGKHMFADVWQTSVVSYSLALVFWRILSRNNYLLVFFKINQFACFFFSVQFACGSSISEDIKGWRAALENNCGYDHLKRKIFLFLFKFRFPVLHLGLKSSNHPPHSKERCLKYQIQAFRLCTLVAVGFISMFAIASAALLLHSPARGKKNLW